jgi:uncharacterized protein YndB with AHSA1/START domain
MHGGFMVDIVHRIGIKGSIAKVYNALATVEGIAAWWTRETRGSSQLGSSIDVRFLTPEGQEKGRMRMVVETLDVNKKIVWRFVEGPEEWIGTEVSFDLAEVDGYTIVLFAHKNWRETVEFTYHCSMKWAIFLLSLRDLIENGKGKPSPIDIKIDNWN